MARKSMRDGTGSSQNSFLESHKMTHPKENIPRDVMTMIFVTFERLFRLVNNDRNS